MALLKRYRVVVPDLETDAAPAGSEDVYEYQRSRLRAVQSTPLVADDGRVLGMLSTHWREAHQPSTADLRRIDALARKCASALAREEARALRERLATTNLLGEVNQRIREAVNRFDATAHHGYPQEYVCECGCGCGSR
jgi:GAF domain-containing protein